jgi:hypothetical protein
MKEGAAMNGLNAKAASQIADERLRRTLDAAIKGLEVHPSEDSLAAELTIRQLRRSRYQSEDDRIGMLTLTEVDGLLVWEHGTGITAAAGLPGRRRAAPGPSTAGTIVKQLKFQKLEPNQIGQFLETLDAKCADTGPDGKPSYGLRRWMSNGAQGDLVPDELPAETGALLLLVHGTFSNGRHIIDEILAKPDGEELLARAAAKYTGGIFVFDHPTLSVSPLLNALDLARLFARRREPVDIVCHSRGGLLTRWFLEVFAEGAARPSKAVFVGSPLRGTGLAAPPRLRSALTLLTNFARALEAGSELAALAVPMLSVVVGIQKVVSSITNVAAKTPLFDAAVAMIPGLAAQSQVSTNAELRRLRERRVGGAPGGPLDYYAICSDFAPAAPIWQFWRQFRNFRDRLAHFGADIIFEAENDLVVDTASMASLYGFDDHEQYDLPGDKIHSFSCSETVHHLNYFRQPETIAHLATWLEI